MSKSDQKLEVYKPSQTILTRDKLSKTATITALIFMREMFNCKEDKDEYSIPVKEVYKMLGSKHQQLTHLKAISTELLQSIIEWNVSNTEKQESFEKSAWCSYIGLKDGVMKFSFSRQLKAILKEAHHLWHATLSIPLIASLSSKHTIKLYEACKLYFIKAKMQTETPSIDLKKWREIFGLQDSQYYQEFKRLKAYVLLPSIKEINEKTDIFIEMIQQEEGKSVKALKFVITPNPNDPLKGLNLDINFDSSKKPREQKEEQEEEPTNPDLKAKIEAFKKARAERKNKNPNIKIDKGLHALKFGG